MPPRSRSIRSRHLVLALLPGLALGLALPARAQNVSVQARQISLRELTDRLAAQTGYSFNLQPGERAAETRQDVDLKDVPLARALRECATLFRCDFYSTDPQGFYVVPHQPDPASRETTLGPYRVRVNPIVATEDPGVVHLTLILSAPDDEQIEAIAGVEGDIRVVDNFGRDLLPPTDRFLLGATSTRVRLSEYWLRLSLTPRDSRSVRVRALTGTLLRYRSVKLLRFEFPLEGDGGAAEGQSRSEQGLEFQLDKFISKGRACTVVSRFQWPERRSVVGRGLSRTPRPYLVDDTGRVYRDCRRPPSR